VINLEKMLGPSFFGPALVLELGSFLEIKLNRGLAGWRAVFPNGKREFSVGCTKG